MENRFLQVLQGLHAGEEKGLEYFEELRKIKFNQLKMLNKTLEETMGANGHVALVLDAIKATLDELDWIAGGIKEFETPKSAEVTDSIENSFTTASTDDNDDWNIGTTFVGNSSFKIGFIGALKEVPSKCIQSVQVMDDEIFLRVFDIVQRKPGYVNSSMFPFKKAKDNQDKVDIILTYESMNGSTLYSEMFNDYYVSSVLGELIAYKENLEAENEPLCYQVSLKKYNG